MKSCLRIPRVFLPREGFAEWAVVARDRFAADGGYWERVAKTVGEAPSSLRCVLPEACLAEAGEDAVAQARERMYEVLEEGTADKLNRGLVFVRRSVSSGIRKGIVAAVDLEQYTAERGKSAPVRPAQEADAARTAFLTELRRAAPLEFTHTLLFYRDKHDKLVRALEEEDLEVLYDTDLMEGGGHLSGRFIPEDLAEEVVHMLRSRSEPAFVVGDGEEQLAAAKAYWEELKPSLKEEEQRNHPARFTLAELVNLCDDAVVLCPVHRLLTEVDAEAFCDFFMKNVPCKRQGNVLFPAFSDAVAGVKKTDEIIARFVRACGGKIGYVRDLPVSAERDSAAVALKALPKDALFSALKGGALPANTFAVGGEKDARYYMESREIGYD